MPLTRTVIRTWTRLAKFAVLLAMALLVIAIIAPLGRVEAPADTSSPEQTSVVESPAAADQTGTPKEKDHPEWSNLASSLSAIRIPPPDDETPDAPDTAVAAKPETSAESVNPDDVPLSPAPPGWQYLGYAQNAGGAVSALVTINATQRFLRAGATVESFRILEIDTARLLLERDNQRFEVRLSRPLPFSVDTSTAQVRNRARNESAQARALEFERQSTQDLEALRQRRIDEMRAAGRDPEQPGEVNNR